MAESLATLVGRTFDLSELGSVHLIAHLGGGRLSQVYRGELRDGRTVAVKIARNDLDENMAANFGSEFKTLNALRVTARQLVAQGAASKFAASYFPEPLHFNPELITHDGRYAIVVLELIAAPKLIDKAVGSEGHVLPEQFGLETAIQYAEMLQVLHAAGYTASDRKIDDVYWRDGSPGTLVVLDWNVVGRGAAGIPDDLFRFGTFWYEFLVGQQPRFANTGNKRVARPNALPGWSELSRGTQSILEKALHPVAKKRYQTAEALKHDVTEQLKRWSMPLDELVEGQGAEGEITQRLASLDMAIRRGHPASDELKAEMHDLELKMVDARLTEFRARVDSFVRMGATHGNNQLSEYIDAFEAARIEFWDDPAVRAEAARFLLVAKAYSRRDALPPRGLLTALKDIPIDSVEILESAQQQVLAIVEPDPTKWQELTYLRDELAVRLLVLEAESASQAGDYLKAAEKFRQAEETRRSAEKQLKNDMEKKLAEERERHDPALQVGSLSDQDWLQKLIEEHEWRDLAARFPDLTGCMVEAFRLHATVTEPSQLISFAVRLARVGNSAGARRALTTASKWTEGDSKIYEILEDLSGFLPRWPELQEEILISPRSPAKALDQLKSWKDDSHRQSLQQNEPRLHQILKSDSVLKDLLAVTGRELVDKTRDDLQDALALRLYVAVASQDVEQVGRVSEELRSSIEQLGDNRTLEQRVIHLRELEEKRVSHYESCLEENLPFIEASRTLVAGREEIETLIESHRAIIGQLDSTAGAVDQGGEETVTSEGNPASAVEHILPPHLGIEAMLPESTASVVRDWGDADVQALGGVSPWMDQLTEPYRAIHGARFSDARGLLEQAQRSISDARGRARVARLLVVAQACAAAVNAGSNPSDQSVKDLIQAVNAMDADSTLNASSTRVAWASEECVALEPGLQMLLREIEFRKSLRKAEENLAKGKFIEAAASFSDTRRNGIDLPIDPPNNESWRDVLAVLPDPRKQQYRLLKPNQALTALDEASSSALADALEGNVEAGLDKLVGPMKEAEALKEPEDHRTFHPLSVWLNKVLVSWLDVSAADDGQLEQSLLGLKRAQLTSEYARKVTSIAHFGDCAASFEDVLDQLDSAIGDKRDSLRDSTVRRIDESLKSGASLADVDRLLSSAIALTYGDEHQRPVLNALERLAKDQVQQGNTQLNPNDRSSPPRLNIEQLARSLRFLQSARLLDSFEEANRAGKSSMSTRQPGARVAEVASKGKHLRELQTVQDAARANGDFVAAQAKVVEANKAGLSLAGSDAPSDWDYVISSKSTLDETATRQSERAERRKKLWPQASVTLGSGEQGK